MGGDVTPGAFIAATLDRLAALEPPVHYVRGNGERETAEMVGAPAPDPGNGMLVAAAAAVAELGDERARALARLADDRRARRHALLPRDAHERLRHPHPHLDGGALGGRRSPAAAG